MTCFGSQVVTESLAEYHVPGNHIFVQLVLAKGCLFNVILENFCAVRSLVRSFAERSGEKGRKERRGRQQGAERKAERRRAGDSPLCWEGKAQHSSMLLASILSTTLYCPYFDTVKWPNSLQCCHLGDRACFRFPRHLASVVVHCWLRSSVNYGRRKSQQSSRG